MRLLAAGMLLGVFAAGCSSQPAASRGSVKACIEFGVAAVKHHVTVTSLPPACQGLTQAQVSFAVGSALHSAAIGAKGKAAQRARIGAASRYLKHMSVSGLAAPSQRPAPAPKNPRISKMALGLAALCAWLVTIALGLQLMMRWLRRGRRGRRRWRPVALNLAHLGLAVVSLLLWIAYLGTGLTGLAWAACVLLALVTALGMALVFLTAAVRTAARTAGGARRTPAAEDPRRSGQGRRRYPPGFVVGAHIVLATLTILLAVLAAIGAAG